MTKGETAVVRAAMAWWKSLRPVGWNEQDHLAAPDVHTKSEREKSLAHAVAMFIRAENPPRSR